MAMFRTGFDVGVHAAPWRREVEVYVVQWGQDGRTRYLLQPRERRGEWVEDFQLVAHEQGTPALLPSFTLFEEAAQRLFDGLWNAGYRPSEGIANAGQLAATERHLADMRAIAFDKLKVDPPAKAS